MMINVLLRETNVSLLNLDGDWAGVDKGALILLKSGIVPTYAFGDFDSVTKEELKFLKSHLKIDIVQSEKDYTDTELCLLSLVEEGYTEIDVYGAFGGRMDHTLMNIHLLQNDALREVNIHLKDKENDLSLLNSGKHKITNKGFKYVSIIPIHENTILSLEELKYELNEENISPGKTLTVSNEFIGDVATVTTNKDILLIYSMDKR